MRLRDEAGRLPPSSVARAGRSQPCERVGRRGPGSLAALRRASVAGLTLTRAGSRTGGMGTARRWSCTAPALCGDTGDAGVPQRTGGMGTVAEAWAP